MEILLSCMSESAELGLSLLKGTMITIKTGQVPFDQEN